MRQWFGSELVQIMACRLFGTKPLSRPGVWGLYYRGSRGRDEWLTPIDNYRCTYLSMPYSSSSLLVRVWLTFYFCSCLRYLLDTVVVRLACASPRLQTCVYLNAEIHVYTKYFAFSCNVFFCCKQCFAIFTWNTRVRTWSKINLVNVALHIVSHHEPLMSRSRRSK